MNSRTKIYVGDRRGTTSIVTAMLASNHLNYGYNGPSRSVLLESVGSFSSDSSPMIVGSTPIETVYSCS